MPDSHYQNQSCGVLDFVQNVVTPYANTVSLGAFEFLGCGRARFVSQCGDVGRKASLKAFRELSELAGCPGCEVNTVGHGGGL